MWTKTPLPDGAITIGLQTYCGMGYQDRPETIWATVSAGIPPGESEAEYREMQVLTIIPYNAAGYNRYRITFFDPETGQIECQDWHLGTLRVYRQ
jgi:hypothetical protein